jgi:conjugative transposon TraM protein
MLNQKNKIKMKSRSLKQKKFLLLLPLLMLPFIAALFALFGGGKRNQISHQPSVALNTKLPDAQFKNIKEKDKLRLYDDAAKDSAHRKDVLKKDPSYKLGATDSVHGNTSQLEQLLQTAAADHNQQRLQTIGGADTADTNEKKVMEKLAQLKTIITKNDQAASTHQKFQSNSTGIDKLQNMVEMVNRKKTEPDPELNQLNDMLNKVMLIQHPEKMQDSMLRLSEKNKTRTFVVTAAASNAFWGNENAFYGLGDGQSKNINAQAIQALIPETQTLVAGATVKLRLLNTVLVGGFEIPKDELVYGMASLSNERLKISVNSIVYQNNIIPVSLHVYDLDGMEGIYIPGSINRDVGKQSASDAISSIGLTSLDPSVVAQAASAGLQAAKSLMTKKIKLVRVTISEGYKVFLKDNNQK